ncbi:lens induction in camera-type eye [Branchiostoma belcheri]|nr:lens induction in camera-type eye [Branchiostoma belcheri]
MAVPNLAVQVAMFNSPIGPTVLREIAATLEIAVPSRSGLQDRANKYSDLMVEENEKDLQTWRETVQNIHVEKGNTPDSGLPVEDDTRYQTPLRNARGKRPGQPSPNSVTNVVENVTPWKAVIGSLVRNKISPTCNMSKASGTSPPPHKCSANIPEEAVIGDEKQAAKEIAKMFLTGPNKTPVGDTTEDGDSSFSTGMKEVMEEAGHEVKAFKDIVHLSKSIKRKVTTGSWSKEMFPGQNQDEKDRVRNRFGDDLSKRLNAEYKAFMVSFRYSSALCDLGRRDYHTGIREDDIDKRWTLTSHRVVFFLNPDLPNLDPKMHVSHLCHNKMCVSPAHLSYEPNIVNQQRRNCFAERRCTGHTVYRDCITEE